MKDESKSRELLERLWRRELTPSEQSQLRQSTIESEADLALETRLTSALRRMPDSFVSSNFTQRVLNAVELENAERSRRDRPRSIVFRWLPRFAVACALAFIGFVSYERLETRRSAEMARSVAIISAPSLPPEILQDFEAIQVMSRTPAADEQLLALME